MTMPDRAGYVPLLGFPVKYREQRGQAPTEAHEAQRGNPPTARELVPLVRIERTTYCLQDSCSTN